MAPNFQARFNGGQHNCGKTGIRDHCKLVPIYSWLYDRKRENLTNIGINQLIGWGTKVSGLCGATVQLARIDVHNIGPNGNGDWFLIKQGLDLATVDGEVANPALYCEGDDAQEITDDSDYRLNYYDDADYTNTVNCDFTAIPSINEMNTRMASKVIDALGSPLFRAGKQAINDTAYYTNYNAAISTDGRTILEPTEMSIVPPNFELRLKGGRYRCQRDAVIKRCSLVPLYNYFMTEQQQTFQTLDYNEYATVSGTPTNVPSLTGYVTKSNGICGATLPISRVNFHNLFSGFFNSVLKLEKDVKNYILQNNFPLNYNHKIRQSYFHGWPVANKAATQLYSGELVKNAKTIDGAH
uniref:Adhesin n=1 Tax=Rhabditophanes sp. KR3021 TaxID=114890 RepID=A0AC35UG72_9BILA